MPRRIRPRLVVLAISIAITIAAACAAVPGAALAGWWQWGGFEAEQMELPAPDASGTSPATIVFDECMFAIGDPVPDGTRSGSDACAPGGAGVRFVRPGRASFITAPDLFAGDSVDGDMIKVRALGESCADPSGRSMPSIVLFVDGVEKVGPRLSTAFKYIRYQDSHLDPSMPHVIEIGMTDAYRSSTCERALIVDRVGLNVSYS